MRDSPSLLPPTLRFLRSQGASDELLTATERVISALQQGHTAVPWSESLDSKLISQDGNSGFLVHHQGRLGLRRLFNQEQRIQQEFLNSIVTPLDRGRLKKALLSLTGSSARSEDIDWQWQAAITMMFHQRCILSGGPGTGKTTTLMRMLLLYTSLFAGNSIAMAAPTGKAAHRMTESLNSSIHKLGTGQNLLDISATTLHRLLGFQPQSQNLSFHQDHPLPYDLVIVDEASMLDVSLTHGLLNALKTDAKLVLIGDKNQLPPIEAGNVFADLSECLLNKNSTINLLSQILDEQNIDMQNLCNGTELQTNFRFSDSQDLIQACDALLQGSNEFLQLLNSSESLTWEDPQDLNLRRQALQLWSTSHKPGETSMILAATNFGPNSVDDMNQLSLQIQQKKEGRFFQNMPLIITKNLHSLGLSNGDLGSIHLQNSQWHATFANLPTSIRADSLSHWQLAYAISIHKSQGSEYDHVLITLPNDPGVEILDRTLLYTAVSRAKKTVTLWGSEEVLRTLLLKCNDRCTFLNN